MFKKILIANRGEIACRVAATAKRMAVKTVAVYSDADANAKHVSACDEAVHIGGSAPKDSYLRWERILEAAKATGAQAIHPGYGFLSENEEFAQACASAGLVFIGPPASAIKAMGLKAESKQLMEKAGVPLVPGYHGSDQDPALLRKEAARIGYPVPIKASAGGGGKGMRAVDKAEDFDAALASCKREAINSFGDDAVLVEKYVQRPRHIEIQVFGDTHGNYVYLFERDCSVQRRHQKVLEEAPAPGMTPQRRREMGEAAVAAARAIGYSGAGTVEFIAEQDGRFYFMEMNTRLQVEHPVTEMITGLDLVEWQLRVAAGERLPLLQDELTFSGHAIEARIYAEDPERDFLPATGKLLPLAFPAETHDVRIDAGVEAGGEITPWYDPMIAKLIVRGSDRDTALARLRRALAETEIAGVTTNVAFLGRVAAGRAFAAAELDTGLIERNRAELFPPRGPVADEMLAVAAFAELEAEEQAAREHARESGDRYSPWHRVDGWRLNEESHHDFVFMDGEAHHAVRVRFSDDGQRLLVGARDYRIERDGPLIRLDGRSFKAHALRDGSQWHVFCNGGYRRLALKAELQAPEGAAVAGSLAAPMPGKVIQVMVEAGARVKKGQPLLILEAMKMEHTITAPADGVVKLINFAAGEQVLEGAELITLE